MQAWLSGDSSSFVNCRETHGSSSLPACSSFNFYGGCSVMVSTSLCESDSTGSNPASHPNAECCGNHSGFVSLKCTVRVRDSAPMDQMSELAKLTCL